MLSSVSYDLKRHLENLAASRPADQSPRRFRFMPIYGKSCESAWWGKPGGRVYYATRGVPGRPVRAVSPRTKNLPIYLSTYSAHTGNDKRKMPGDPTRLSSLSLSRR